MRVREHQRGSVLATSAVILAGLIGVAGLSVLSVQRSLGVSGQQRGHAQALHAAEAGVAAAATFLRKHIAQGSNWSPYVVASCSTTACAGTPVTPPDIVGNTAMPGSPDNPFDGNGVAAQTWYEVTLFNNPTDPGFGIGKDQDAIIVMRSTGHGPDGARVVIEVEVGGKGVNPADALCVGYAQQGMSELNSGRNDCFSGAPIDTGDTTTTNPGGL